MPNVLITGSNRGIGFEFAKQYLKKGWNVFACCRNPDNAKELQELANNHPNKLSIFKLDITNTDQITSLADKLKDKTIDVFINNAGYFGHKNTNLTTLDAEDWLRVFESNTIAPILLTRAFIKQIEASDLKLVVAISSTMGSIAKNADGGEYIYRSSKAALNMANKTLAIDLKDKGITVVSMHPGWVKTAMGGEQAPLMPEESVSSMIDVIDKLTPKDNGTFINYDGTILPW
jgi:NAD(P)-dependent dehydrogenase (short-subunit alcohol dehydrogenase family)